MREEVHNWLLQGEEDFDTAKLCFTGKKYYMTAFLCQQTVEKALKALFLHKNKGLVPQSHSLIYLAENTNIPKNFYSFLKQLTPKFIDTRYPDASIDLPVRIYDAENTKPILEKTKEVLEWIKKELK